MDAPQTTRVLFIWHVREELQHYLHSGIADRSDIELIFPEEQSEAEYSRLAADADIIVGWRPTEALLNAAPKLKLLINPGVGVLHLIEMFRNLNQRRTENSLAPVTLANGHGNTYFTAQHTVAMLLALLTKLIPHHNWMHQGKWRMGDEEAKSVPLRGQCIGLLGYGELNSKVHRMLAGFNVSFAALKREWDDAQQDDGLARYTPEQMGEFLTATDILVVGVPHTSHTTGLIGKQEIKQLGQGSILVNVARGKVVDEDALYEALASGFLSGAALDVWYDYRPEPDDEGRLYPMNRPFHELSNVVFSPHRAASPFDDLERWEEVVDNIKRVADGRSDLRNVVDLDREY